MYNQVAVMLEAKKEKWVSIKLFVDKSQGKGLLEYIPRFVQEYVNRL